MFQLYKSRAESFGEYIIANNSTIRATAKAFNYSKSLVHNDISYKLKKLNIDMYIDVKRVLENNYNQRHIRGGEATKQKYAKVKKE